MLSWDRSDDWVIQQSYNDFACVKIHFKGDPSAGELRALRICLPQFRNTPPRELRESVRNSGKVFLRAMPTREARRIIEAARRVGLDAEIEDASFIANLPYNRTTGCAWLIEDERDSQAIVEQMIAAGVPIQHVEA